MGGKEEPKQKRGGGNGQQGVWGQGRPLLEVRYSRTERRNLMPEETDVFVDMKKETIGDHQKFLITRKQTNK